MTKPFNIHDWQAKQRLTEERSQESMSNADIRALQIVISKYSLNKILNTLAVISDKTGKHDEAYMIQKLASQIQDFPTDMDEMNTIAKEHHGDDFPKDLLDKKVSSFLDDLKKKSETDYDAIEDIMKKHFSIDEMNSLGSAGAGASFQAGNSDAYATPNAFGDDKKKKMKAYKSIGYKKV